MDIIMESYTLYESDFLNLQSQFLVDYAELCETGLVLESDQLSLVDKLKSFITSLVRGMENFLSKLALETGAKISTDAAKKKLKSLRDEIKNDPEASKKTYKVPDFSKMSSLVKEANSQLSTYADRLIKNNYKYSKDIEEDLYNAQIAIDNLEKKFDDILESKKELSANEFLKYYDNMVTGRNNPAEMLKKEISIFGELSSSVNSIGGQYKALGPEILKKKTTAIQRLTSRISSFFRKIIAKFISTIVFLFA